LVLISEISNLRQIPGGFRLVPRHMPVESQVCEATQSKLDSYSFWIMLRTSLTVLNEGGETSS
jgi:hypothetical protein